MKSCLERRVHLSCDAANVFDLVADIERYPEFVPGCREARIISRESNRLLVDQLVGLGPAHWRFTTEARLDRPRAIDIETRDAPFGKLDIHWKFNAAGSGGCETVFLARYDLKSRLLQRLASGVMEDSLLKTLHAFEAQARRLGA